MVMGKWLWTEAACEGNVSRWGGVRVAVSTGVVAVVTGWWCGVQVVGGIAGGAQAYGFA